MLEAATSLALSVLEVVPAPSLRSDRRISADRRMDDPVHQTERLRQHQREQQRHARERRNRIERGRRGSAEALTGAV